MPPQDDWWLENEKYQTPQDFPRRENERPFKCTFSGTYIMLSLSKLIKWKCTIKIGTLEINEINANKQYHKMKVYINNVNYYSS
jgi:hypothetical protein